MKISEAAASIREANPDATGNDIDVVAEYLRDNPDQGDILDPEDARKIAQLAGMQIREEQEAPQESPAPYDVTRVPNPMAQPAPQSPMQLAGQVARGSLSLFYPTLMQDVRERGGKQAEFSDVPTAIGETTINALGGLTRGIAGPARRLLAESALSGALSQGVESMNGRNPYAGAVGLAAPVVGRAVQRVIGLFSSKSAQGFARDVASGAGGASSMNPANIIRWGIAPEAERDFIRSQANKEAQIGAELVDFANNPPTGQEAEVIHGILPALGYMDLKRPIAALKAPRLPEVMTGSEKTNAVIDDQIARIEKFGRDRATKANKNIMGQRGNHPLDNWNEIPASEYRDLRTQIGSKVSDWGEGVDLAAIDKAYKNAYGVMRGDLIDAAGAAFPNNAEYAETMAKWHDKLDASEQALRIIGKNPETQAKNAEGFIGRIAGQNKAFQRDALQNLDDVFGTDYLKRADAAQVAQDLGVGMRPTVGIGGGAGEIMQSRPRFWSRNEQHEFKAGDILKLHSPRLAAGAVGATARYMRTPIPAVADALSAQLPGGLGSAASILGSTMLRGGGLSAGRAMEGEYDRVPYEAPSDATRTGSVMNERKRKKEDEE